MIGKKIYRKEDREGQRARDTAETNSISYIVAMLVPPANFGIPEEGIYRCSKLETINLSFLETLNLKTIIFVGGQLPSNFFKEFFDTSGIEYFVIKTLGDSSSLIAPDQKKRQLHHRDESLVHKNGTEDDLATDEGYRYSLTDQDDLMLIKSQSIQRICKIMLDVSYHNVLLVDKTSVVIGILRKVQKWELSSIISEYRLFTGKNRNYFAETFLELINIRLIQDDTETKPGASTSTPNSVRSRSPKRRIAQQDRQTSSHTGETQLTTSQQDLNSQGTVIVQESDLLMPPEVPQHMMSMIQNMELNTEGNSKTQQKPQGSMALGIFGNRYRLAFDRRERGEYTYYEPTSPKDAFSISVPREELLPTWFKYQRDLWDQQHAVQEHNYYKESIFA